MPVPIKASYWFSIHCNKTIDKEVFQLYHFETMPLFHFGVTPIFVAPNQPMSTLPTLLMVDDDTDLLELASMFLKDEFVVHTASTKELARKLAIEIQPQLVLLDMNLEEGASSGEDGFELLTFFRNNFPHSEVLMNTAFAELDLAVQAMKMGARDFVAKPWKPSDLLRRLKSVNRPSKALEDPPKENLILSHSAAMQSILQEVQLIAETDANVLITGENGTGKNLLARNIHQLSGRQAKPMIEVDMGSIPTDLFEAEMFGAEKGAYTGADQQKKGLFQAAHKGTLFLDEIGNLAANCQAKMLSALQDRIVRPIGGVKTVHVDVRVIAATNAQLTEKVAEGVFREDLFYRLNTVTLRMPSLRERKEDIIPLAYRFVQEFSARYGRNVETLDDAAHGTLESYHWPGNVRELKNVIEHAVILNRTGVVHANDLRITLQSNGTTGQNEGFDFNLEKIEKRTITRALQQCQGNLSLAAKSLGLGRTTLYRKMAKYGIA